MWRLTLMIYDGDRGRTSVVGDWVSTVKRWRFPRRQQLPIVYRVATYSVRDTGFFFGERVALFFLYLVFLFNHVE